MIRMLFDRLFHRPKPTWLERHFIVTVLLAAVAAMAISLAIGLHQSVWFDESYSILVAKQPVAQLVQLTSVDTHPPLYYLLLKAWGSIFGWSAVALRGLSVLAMGGALTVGAFLVRRLFGVRAAVISLPFVAFAPFLLRYGFEIRMYALASLIGIAATYVLVRGVQAKTANEQAKYYIFYALLVALGVYTLYYTVLLWIAHVVWLLWLDRKYKWAMIKRPWFLAFIGSLVLFLPWLPTFVSQITHNALAPIAQALTMENLSGIVSFAFLYRPSWQLTGLTSLIVLFVIITVSFIVIRAFKQVSGKEKPYLVLFSLYWMVPILVIAAISLVSPMYVERYLSHVLIGASLFIGVSLAFVVRLDKKMGYIGGALLVVMIAGVIHLEAVGNYNFQRLQTPETKAIVSSYGCNDTTYIASGPFAYIEGSYELSSCDFRFFATVNPVFHGGFAPLHDSDKRLTSTTSLMAKRLLLVDFNSNHKVLVPDGRYHFVGSKMFDGTQVNEYQQ